jgi:hypothetical protein
MGPLERISNVMIRIKVRDNSIRNGRKRRRRSLNNEIKGSSIPIIKINRSNQHKVRLI